MNEIEKSDIEWGINIQNLNRVEKIFEYSYDGISGKIYEIIKDSLCEKDHICVNCSVKHGLYEFNLKLEKKDFKNRILYYRINKIRDCYLEEDIYAFDEYIEKE